MNWLLIVILLLVVGNVIWGYKKGFMKVALSLVSWLLVLLACYIATPIVAEGIVKNTPIAGAIHDGINAQINSAIEEAMEGSGLQEDKVLEIEAALPEQIRDAIFGEDENLWGLVKENTTVDIDTTKLSDAASYLIALVVVCILSAIALKILEGVLGLVAKLPLIGQADTLLGIAAGLLRGLIYSWLIITIITFLTYTGLNTDLMTLVNESKVLTWLYENNLILLAVKDVL